MHARTHALEPLSLCALQLHEEALVFDVCLSQHGHLVGPQVDVPAQAVRVFIVHHPPSHPHPTHTAKSTGAYHAHSLTTMISSRTERGTTNE
jgi:hypothetical protein